MSPGHIEPLSPTVSPGHVEPLSPTVSPGHIEPLSLTASPSHTISLSPATSPVYTVSLGPVAPLDHTVSLGPVAPLDHTMSLGPTTPPGPQSPDPNRMDMDPVPAVTAPASDSPLSIPDPTSEITLSPSLDLDIATRYGLGATPDTDNSSILDTNDLSVPDTSDSSVPDLDLLPPRDASQQLSSDSLMIVSQLPVATAVEGTFDIKGVHGKFITAATIQFWENILGGEKWIKMVQSYLDLERMPPTKNVCNNLLSAPADVMTFSSSMLYVYPHNPGHTR